MELRKALALVLKEIRDEEHLSQEKLAEKCHFSTTVIGRLETWKREPKLSTIFKLSEGLDIPACEIIKRIDEKKKKT